MSFLRRVSQLLVVDQKRFRYTDWRMRRDAKRRTTLKEKGPTRENLEAVIKNDVLPIEIQVFIYSAY